MWRGVLGQETGFGQRLLSKTLYKNQESEVKKFEMNFDFYYTSILRVRFRTDVPLAPYRVDAFRGSSDFSAISSRFGRFLKF